MLEERECITATDHKPLTYAFDQKPDKASSRQIRHLDYIGQFSTQIFTEYTTLLQILFHHSNHYMLVRVSTEDIADAQSQNQELQSLLESKISLELCKLLDNTERTIYCDISDDNVYSYIPSFLKQKIFDVTRCLSHPGVRATKQLITRRFV